MNLVCLFWLATSLFALIGLVIALLRSDHGEELGITLGVFGSFIWVIFLASSFASHWGTPIIDNTRQFRADVGQFSVTVSAHGQTTTFADAYSVSEARAGRLIQVRKTTFCNAWGGELESKIDLVFNNMPFGP